MLTQNVNNETKKLGQECKLTIDEIRQFPGFRDIDEVTLAELSDFVYQISSILYKANHNEPT